MANDEHRIHFFVDGTGPCAWYRALTPAHALRDLGYAVGLSQEVTAEALEWSSVIVFQRRYDRGLPELIQQLRELGKLVVYDIDDDLWHIHPDNPAKVHYGLSELDIIERSIQNASLTTTTTAHLANRLRPLARSLAVLPNMLPDRVWGTSKQVEQDPRRVVVGWAGSNTHLPDLKILTGIVEQLLDRHPHAEFAFAGMSQLPFAAHDRIQLLDVVPLQHYHELLAQFHVGIAPVVDSVFNRGKSDLKYLEYAGLGIPAVVSRTETYSGSVENGVTGFLAGNPKDWLKYLSRLIDDVESRRSMGAAARLWSRTRTMEVNVGLWEEAYGLRGEERLALG